jgi:hypothetical protein
MGEFIGEADRGQGTFIELHCFAADTTVEASRLVFNSVRAFSSVIVAIDSGRTKGINLDKLADYAGMVGLAEIKRDADIGGAPTILRLFSRRSTTPVPMFIT